MWVRKVRAITCFLFDVTYVEAHGQEPQVVRCEERFGERAVFRVREVIHRARDKLAIEHKRESVDVPQQLVS